MEGLACHGIESASCATRDFREQRLSLWNRLSVGLAKDIVKAARSAGADLIHAHSPFYNGLAAARAAATLGIPAVYEMRGVWEETAVTEGRARRGSLPWRAYRAFEKRASAAAARTILPSRAMQEELGSRGMGGPFCVVPNGAGPAGSTPDPSPPPQIEAWLARRESSCVLCHAGSIRHLERLERTIALTEQLVDAGCCVSLVIVGQGSAAKDIRCRMESSPASAAMLYHDHLPVHEASWVLGRADVFLLTRGSDPVSRVIPPLKIVHAMASRCCVVAGDLPCIRETIDSGRTGVLVPPDDDAALFEGVRSLVCDADMRRRLADAAHTYVAKERSWKAVTEPLVDVYTRALHAHAARGS
jgi:glycosyltransferase involved in cell wall biosynthesis